MLRASLFEANLQKTTKQETEIDIDTLNFFVKITLDTTGSLAEVGEI